MEQFNWIERNYYKRIAIKTILYESMTSDRLPHYFI